MPIHNFLIYILHSELKLYVDIGFSTSDIIQCMDSIRSVEKEQDGKPCRVEQKLIYFQRHDASKLQDIK